MEFSWKNEVRPVWSLWTVLKISSSRKLILMELYRVVRLRPQLVLLLIYLWLDVHSHSVPSSILRATGAVVPWCWKERLRRRIFDSWSLVLFFFGFDTITTHIFLSFVDIRDVIHLHIQIHGLTFTFTFLAQCMLGRLRAFHPSPDLPRKDPDGGLWESADEFDRDW